ncbi:tail protein X [Lysinibacillus xylanilyticus]|uniref:tail protein X n=1 Tax=Lysinibacillus xylanilyticus TaxID=582475 RepID=UPI003D97FF57
MSSYTTVQGDTWDLIAYKLWGSEYLLPLLFEVNPQCRDILIFEGGLLLNVPEVSVEDIRERPEWLGEEDEL